MIGKTGTFKYPETVNAAEKTGTFKFTETVNAAEKKRYL